jgi:RND family efflux transporter MFP subunit
LKALPKGVVLVVLLVTGCDGARGEAQKVPDGGGAPAPTPTIDVVAVLSRPLDAVTRLEGELTPYEAVALHARANGFVQRVLVDRGSKVKGGELLVTIVAPELGAQRAEAEAKLVGDKSTFDRLKAASQTPGAVAGNEVEVAEAKVRADQSHLEALRVQEQYLVVTAPFAGVITERNVHPGALVGPQNGPNTPPMLRIEDVAKLRLTVPVPESLVGAIAEGTPATFTVRAYPGVKFTGVTKRVSRSVDAKTRSMPVELDVDNVDGRLAAGMFVDVAWPVKRSEPSLFVPPSAIVQSTERTFVARVNGGTVDQVSVQRGVIQGELVEVFGGLRDGDTVARRGTEELRQGLRVETRPAPRSPPPQ